MEERIDKVEERQRDCEVHVAGIQKEIKGLWKGLDAGLKRHCERLKVMEEGMKDIANNLSKRLPNWATALITILTSLSIGLLVYAATHH
ncbi:MAG: hypothetical protein KAU20_05845 [Nanoarchaeota archaeon]|nr:hypothetical protein [Nanoarchaeota archaeon]